MKLYEACDIGYTCGLETIGECVDNISVHAYNIFGVDEAPTELNELFKEVNEKEYKTHESVEKIIGRCRMKQIDKEINDKVFGYKEV